MQKTITLTAEQESYVREKYLLIPMKQLARDLKISYSKVYANMEVMDLVNNHNRTKKPGKLKKGFFNYADYDNRIIC